MIEMRSDSREWVSAFFSGRNLIKWEDLIDGALPDDWGNDVVPWLCLLEEGDLDTPICLPCLRDDQTVKWYLGSRSSQGSHALIDELKAFIGKSYTDFDGRPYTFDASDIIEAALLGVFVGPHYVITGNSGFEVSVLRKKFAQYQSLICRRPPFLRSVARPFGLIRREFDLSLLAGNEKDARRLLDEMKKSGRLTSNNIIFLEIRLFAGLGLWQQIVLERGWLRDLVDVPLPPRVVRDVSEAHYRVFIQPYERSGDLKNCLEELKSTSLNRLGPLFARRYGIEDTSVLKMFLFHDLLRPGGDKAYARKLLTRLIGLETNLLLESVAEHLTALDSRVSVTDLDDKEVEDVSKDVWKEADEAFQYQEYDRAIILYSELPVTPKSLQKMAFCALCEEDEERIRDVIQRYEKLLQKEDHAIESKTVKLIGRLKDLLDTKSVPHYSGSMEDAATQAKPSGWLAWGVWVSGGISESECGQVLAQESQRWQVKEISHSLKNSEKLADLIGNADPDAERVFRSCFSVLFSAFVLDLEEPNANLRSLYKSLLFLIVTSDAISINDLEISSQLINSLLTIGLSDTEYGDLIDQLSDLLKREGAPSTLNWALDIAEILALSRSPDNEARLRFVSSTVDLAQKLLHRLNGGQWHSLELLYKDFQMDPPDSFYAATEDAKDEEEIDLSQRLAEKKIGIYTLTEQAGVRAAKIIRDISPTCNVVLNKDTECTERLSSLASSADIFIFAWKSSKHQAFYCVKKHRPSDMPFLQPIGKGSSSIIKEICDHV